jgi:hypothetical protein
METGRDLDAVIAREVDGWKPAKLGKDARGEHECEVLTRDGKLQEGFHYPNVGQVHLAYHCPEYSRDVGTAMAFARRVGLSLDDVWGLSAETISQLALQHWRETSGLRWLKRLMVYYHASKPRSRKVERVLQALREGA